MSGRGVLVPGANSPQLLTRLLEAVARGVRTTRGLQESCGVQGQTVRSYLQAGEWLGLLETTDPIVLSPLGLEFVYAGARRALVYVRAVWSNAFAADLLVAEDGRLPEFTHVERAIQALEPELAAATVRRRASAVRSLIAPAVGRPRPRPREQEELQLALPLGHAPHALSGPPVTLEAATPHDPDAYRLLYASLLDHGELELGDVRGLLDRAGASDLPIGPLVDMALTRGDADRVGDHLVATRGGLDRRDLAETTVSILLSDPAYRRHLLDLEEMRSSGSDPHFGAWDDRLFDGAVEGSAVRQRLAAVLLDRSLEAFPLAGEAGASLLAVPRPFLDAWEQPGLPIALPPTLAQLQGGVAAVNRLLAAASGTAGVPTIASRAAVVHGGLVFPTERPPGAVPDLRSLRQRVLACSPGPALLAAILLLHRQQPERVSLVGGRGGWGVQVGLEVPIPLMEFLERLAVHRGWILVRRGAGSIDANALVRVGEAMGVATVVGRRAVLAEDLAVRVVLDPEEMELKQRLQALTDAVAAALEPILSARPPAPDPIPDVGPPQMRRDRRQGAGQPRQWGPLTERSVLGGPL